MRKCFLGVIAIIVFVMGFSILIIGLDNNLNIRNLNKEKSRVNKNNIKIKEVYNNEDLNINVFLSKEYKVKNMNIEEYVIGVVSAEMPAEFNIEALKAQAVAARTYGLTHKTLFGGNKSKGIQGADVSDTTNYQVFISKEERMKLWPSRKKYKYWDKVKDAVNETKGEILIYNGEIIKAPYYFSTSSGKTEDALDVFNKDIPYLKGVSSPGEEKSKKYITKFSFKYRDFISKLNNYSDIKLNKSNLIRRINILERSSGGHVKKIRLGNTYISGRSFRKIFNLTSSNFYIKFNKYTVDVICKGYGHGVGMSQWGANAMAKEGYNYKEILKHYYNGINILKLKTE